MSVLTRAPSAPPRSRTVVKGAFRSSPSGRSVRRNSAKQTVLGDRPLRVVAVRDVTERERTAALLRESEAQILLGSLKDPHDRAQAEAIHTAGRRAASLTKQMLAYAGRSGLSTAGPVDLGELWQELRALLDAALSKKAHVELALGPNSVVLGERSALMQVFMNLLTNASDALEDKPGRIFVNTERVREPAAHWRAALGAPLEPGNFVLIKVRDTGAGMDEATQSRIFEPFLTTKARGHGLGLGSCRRVLVIDDERLVRTHMRRLPAQHASEWKRRPTGKAGSKPSGGPSRTWSILT